VEIATPASNGSQRRTAVKLEQIERQWRDEFASAFFRIRRPKSPGYVWSKPLGFSFQKATQMV
jgi:hypothetical protein